MDVPYIPGIAPPPELPLGRFLPPIPAGMARSWCRSQLNPGDWVLEPFGFNPLMVIEIASAGFPVLVSVNNPIHAFLLKILASAPGEEDLVAALQDLAIASKGDERMEPYIRSMYHVNCGNCHRQVEATAFLWKKEAEQPYAAQVECPYCGARGEQPLHREALERLTPLPPKSLHLARALNRIAERDDALRAQVENALNAYPTRPLIILQTIINKLDGLEQSPRRRELLIALILSAAEQGNTMWAYPSPRNRPRQIVVPSAYQERNLWKVMEESVKTWQIIKTPIPVSEWQGISEGPKGIYIFKGRIRELTPPPPEGFFSAILAAFPRPNQAFWTLSALWTGWIWGQQAVSPIRQVLARQRYDWNWHCHALMGIFDAIHSFSHPALKFWGLIPENEPMLLLAALLAGDARSFRLEAFAQSTDDQLAQCRWSPIPRPTPRTQPEAALLGARNAIINYLKNKGEPAVYQRVHAAAITGLAHQNKLAIDIFLQNINQSTSETQKLIESLFTEPGLLTRASGGTASLDTGDWWLRNPVGAESPLIDRLEEVLYNHLIEFPSTSAEEIKRVVYHAFPGIYTPEDALILNCLASYADLVDPPAHLWALRPSEQPNVRQADEQAILSALIRIAERLDFSVSGTQPIYWYQQGNPSPQYRFHILTSAIISPYLQEHIQPAQTNILVLPGSRANLLAFKTHRDPILRAKLDHSYLLVKFRLIRDLEVNPLLTRDLFKERIRVDPPEYIDSQLALL